MSAPADSAVRSGEELPIGAVDAWVRAKLPTLEGLPKVTQYRGGASNWTYRLEYPGRDLILRRPPAGTKAKSAHDMGREFKVQQALKPHYPYVPEMIGLCEDESVLGAPFYVMERIPGLILRANLPAGMNLDATQARALCLSVIDRLVELHRVDVSAAGLAALGKGPGYVHRQVEGWADRYDRARTWNVPRFTAVKAWLRERAPQDVGACVIHNDYRFDNVVLDPTDATRVVGVLDWEMATIGDPLMDLGSSLAYWVQADDDLFAQRIRRQPTHIPGMLTRAEVIEYYLERTGRSAVASTFYEVFGLFRLAGIIQQIYFRYQKRQTRNPAFRHFWLFVHYFQRRCLKLIGSGS